MFRLPVVTLLSSLGALAWLAAPAGAQTEPPTQTQTQTQTTTPDPDTTPPYNVDTQTQTAPPAPTQMQTQAPVVVQPAPQPAPVIVQQPAPVTQETTTVVVPPRERAATISVGGGVSDFTNANLRSRTGLNAAYEARLSFGINAPLALEAAYVGTAANIKSLGLDTNAMLISNGAEALARLNIGTLDFQPYIVGGASWVRYDVVNASFNTSDVRSSDDVFAIPAGAGVAKYLGDSGLVLDARFTYRFNFNDDLIRSTPGNANAGLDNWMATLKLGYAF